MSIPPDIQYCVDSEFELLGFTDDVGHFMRTYLEDWSWFDNKSAIVTFASESISRYSKWLKTAPIEQQNACIISGITSWKNHLSDVHKEVVHQAVESLYKKLSKGRGKKELHSTRYIRNTLQKSESYKRLKELYRHFIDGFVIDNDMIDSGCQEINRTNNVQNEFHECYLQYDNIEHHVPRKPAKNKREVKKLRKRSVKATNMLAKLAGKETARIYVSGQEVKITGQEIEIRITKNDFYSTDWTTNAISFYDLNGNKLAKSCVYFKNTPAAEQIAAMVLTVQSGDEYSIVSGGNLYDITQAGSEHPMIQRVLEEDREKYLYYSEMESFRAEGEMINSLDIDPEERQIMMGDLHRRAIQNQIDITLYRGERGKAKVIRDYSTDEYFDQVAKVMANDPFIKRMIDLHSVVYDRSNLRSNIGNSQEFALAMSSDVPRITIENNNGEIQFVNAFQEAELVNQNQI